MLARFEYLDFVATKDRALSLEQAKAASYQQGVADGRTEVLNEQQEQSETSFVRDCLVFIAGFGTAFFFAAL